MILTGYRKGRSNFQWEGRSDCLGKMDGVDVIGALPLEAVSPVELSYWYRLSTRKPPKGPPRLTFNGAKLVGATVSSHGSFSFSRGGRSVAIATIRI